MCCCFIEIHTQFSKLTKSLPMNWWNLIFIVWSIYKQPAFEYPRSYIVFSFLFYLINNQIMTTRHVREGNPNFFRGYFWNNKYTIIMCVLNLVTIKETYLLTIKHDCVRIISCVNSLRAIDDDTKRVCLPQVNILVFGNFKSRHSMGHTSTNKLEMKLCDFHRKLPLTSRNPHTDHWLIYN